MIVIPVAICVVAWSVIPVAAWIIVMLLLAAFIVLGGYQITHKLFGALIDERNKVSLSRLQTILWTILVVSALLVAGLANIRQGGQDPLNIKIPPELWIVLGISVTSLVGAGLIKQDKAKAEPQEQPAKLALAKSGRAEAQNIRKDENVLVTGDPQEPTILAIGTLTVNDNPNQASWLDIFKAEEVGNDGRLDIGKVQVFYFTIILLVVYGAALASMFHGHAKSSISAFPVLSESMLALLGISHAAYLTNKAVPRTPTI
jgi:hypothetical protein